MKTNKTKTIGSRKAPHKLLRGSAGFTLIEMLVVLVIIGLIMGLVGPRVLNYLTDARVKAAKLQIEAFVQRARPLFPRHRPLPVLFRRASGAGAQAGQHRCVERALSQGRTGAAGSVEERVRQYRAPGQSSPFEIISLGADGREGGNGSAADIFSGSR